MKVLARWTGRTVLAVVTLGFAFVVCSQFAQMIERNVAVAGDLRSVDDQVSALRLKKAEQEREITRLSDPYGAVPEIHDRLRLVGPHEAIIYLKGGGTVER